MELGNGKRGNNASYTPWCSFGIVEGKDLEFIVHLDKPTQVSKVIFGSLFNPAMRILPAGGVAVEVSADGKQYTRIAEKALKHDYPETGRIAISESFNQRRGESFNAFKRALKTPLSLSYIHDHMYAHETIEIKYGVNILFCKNRLIQLSFLPSLEELHYFLSKLHQHYQLQKYILLKMNLAIFLHLLDLLLA